MFPHDVAIIITSCNINIILKFADMNDATTGLVKVENLFSVMLGLHKDI